MRGQWLALHLGLVFLGGAFFGGIEEIKPWQLYAALQSLLFGGLIVGFFSHEGKPILKTSTRPAMESVILAAGCFTLSGGLFWILFDQLDSPITVGLILTAVSGAFLWALATKSKSFTGFASRLLLLQLVLYPFCLSIGLILSGAFLSLAPHHYVIFPKLGLGIHLLVYWSTFAFLSSVPTFLFLGNRILRRVLAIVTVILLAFALIFIMSPEPIDLFFSTFSVVLVIPPILFSFVQEMLVRRQRIRSGI